jgi:hypothetical protein
VSESEVRTPWQHPLLRTSDSMTLEIHDSSVVVQKSS